MRWKRRLAWVLPLAAGLVLLLSWRVVWDAVLSGLLLVQVATPLQPGPLQRVTQAPIREAVRFSGAGRTIEATLFRPAADRGTGIILVHGVNETGKDDEHIVWLAELLARSGFVVLTPDFLGFKSLTLRPGDVEELVASIRYLAAQSGGGRGEGVGLIGFSYGAGPTVIAASDGRVRDLVRFVVSFGGYYDLLNVITFITTGHYEFGAIRGQTVPNEYSRWIFLRYNLELIRTPRDRDILKEIAEAKARNAGVDAEPLARGLGAEGRAVYELLVNRDPARVQGLVTALGPAIQEHIRFLSPSRVIRDFRGRLFVVHSDPDDYLPKTESLRLAAAVADRDNVHLALLTVFQHVRPNFPDLGLESFVRVYLPEGGKLFWLMFDLVRQRHRR